MPGYEERRTQCWRTPRRFLGRSSAGVGRASLQRSPQTPPSWPLALACILDDPRFDRQGDSRSDYYARLAVQCHLPLAAVEGYLRSRLDERAHKYTDLQLDTLASLTSRGGGEAARILARYLAYGRVRDGVWAPKTSVYYTMTLLKESTRLVLRPRRSLYGPS